MNNKEDLYEELLEISTDLRTNAVPSTIYHYTSMEALFNGILCRVNDESKICLRASNVLAFSKRRTGVATSRTIRNS